MGVRWGRGWGGAGGRGRSGPPAGLSATVAADDLGAEVVLGFGEDLADFAVDEASGARGPADSGELAADLGPGGEGDAGQGGSGAGGGRRPLALGPDEVAEPAVGQFGLRAESQELHEQPGRVVLDPRRRLLGR